MLHYVRMYVCMYVCMYVFMYVCMYVCLYACMYVCMYVCMLAAVVLNRDMGPIAHLQSLGELPAAVLEALPAPRTPLDVADVPHHVGLPGARMQHAMLSMSAADGGMPMLMTVSLQHVMQQQQMHAPQPGEENARRWLHVEDVPPTHTVGMADMGKLVVLEGAEYCACVRV